MVKNMETALIILGVILVLFYMGVSAIALMLTLGGVVLKLSHRESIEVGADS
jgi:hypothetical protein